jgi:histidinol dehydrogenase
MAVETASANIRAFAEMQCHGVVERGGAVIAPRQILRPLDTVAAYSRGRHPLPSTLMMTAIPAQVAGVRRVCGLPQARSVPAGAAARDPGRFQMGGAQAIAALRSVRALCRKRPHRGSGNIYAAAAKKLLAGEAGIDFVGADGDSDHRCRR